MYHVCRKEGLWLIDWEFSFGNLKVNYFSQQCRVQYRSQFFSVFVSHCVNSNDDYIAFALFYIELIVTGNLFMTPMTHKTSRLEVCQYLSNYTSAEANTPHEHLYLLILYCQCLTQILMVKQMCRLHSSPNKCCQSVNLKC